LEYVIFGLMVSKHKRWQFTKFYARIVTRRVSFIARHLMTISHRAIQTSRDSLTRSGLGNITLIDRAYPLPEHFFVNLLSFHVEIFFTGVKSIVVFHLSVTCLVLKNNMKKYFSLSGPLQAALKPDFNTVVGF
jgi:hypothetical protein